MSSIFHGIRWRRLPNGRSVGQRVHVIQTHSIHFSLLVSHHVKKLKSYKGRINKEALSFCPFYNNFNIMHQSIQKGWGQGRMGKEHKVAPQVNSRIQSWGCQPFPCMLSLQPSMHPIKFTAKWSGWGGMTNKIKKVSTCTQYWNQHQRIYVPFKTLNLH